MLKFFTVILLLIPAALKAQSFLEVLEQKAEVLKTVRTIDSASIQVKSLRQDLSVRPLARDASPNEVQKIVKTIVSTETASLLTDGAYDFQFSKTAYQLPNGILTDRERIHYGYVFCLARATHLLALNPLFNREDVTTMLGIDVLSRHMPEWIKDIFRVNLKQVDWLEWVKPYLNIKGFALTQVRQKERELDQKKRKIFTLTVTDKDLNEEKELHKKFQSQKGFKLDYAALLKPGTYIFDAYAINFNGACMFYACQGPYGYYDVPDFGTQILDNLDSDPYLQDLVKKYIAEHFYAPKIYQILSNTKEHIENFAHLNKLKQERDQIDRSLPYEIYNQHSQKINEKRKSLTTQIITRMSVSTVKQVVGQELNRLTIMEPGQTSYLDIIAYLNNLNIYGFSKSDKTDNTLKFGYSVKHVAYKHGRTISLLIHNGHVSHLVARDDNPASLLEYIKAIEHEKKHRVTTHSGYAGSYL